MDTGSHFALPRIPKPAPAAVLQPIATQLGVPGDGHLDVAYRLVKGDPSSDKASCVYGLNPSTNEVESHFSSRDDAALELTISNHSGFNLKNVHVTGIQLHYLEDDGTVGKRADVDTLPDGNRFFDVVPADSWFGDVAKGRTAQKYLGLTTRGVRPGVFYVHLELSYDLEASTTELNLPLAVNPD